MDFFKNLEVKPFLKISIFSLFSNCDTVSPAGGDSTSGTCNDSKPSIFKEKDPSELDF